MTATSELFVMENVRDIVRDKLKKRYGDKYEGVNVECPDDWLGYWLSTDFPDTGKARILNKDDKPIGTVTWKTTGRTVFEDTTAVDVRVTIDGEPPVKLKKYTIDFSSVTVEAEDEAEAREIALGLIMDGEVELADITEEETDEIPAGVVEFYVVSNSLPHPQKEHLASRIQQLATIVSYQEFPQCAVVIVQAPEEKADQADAAIRDYYKERNCKIKFVEKRTAGEEE